MIVPDVNLLLYAYDDTSSAHQAASRWWGDRLNGQEFVGISTLTILAFVRLSTKPGLFVNPYSTEEAGTVVRGWFQSPAADLLELELPDLELIVRLLDETGTGGDLTTDAAIAALAIRCGGTVHSADQDFARFTGVPRFNPLTGKRG